MDSSFATYFDHRRCLLLLPVNLCFINFYHTLASLASDELEQLKHVKPELPDGTARRRPESLVVWLGDNPKSENIALKASTIQSLHNYTSLVFTTHRHNPTTIQSVTIITIRLHLVCLLISSSGLLPELHQVSPIIPRSHCLLEHPGTVECVSTTQKLGFCCGLRYI